jgi:predicted esterase
VILDGHAPRRLACESPGQTTNVNTVEYAPGRHADLFGQPEQKTILLWHGAQADARASVRSLAELLAAHGVAVVAPDWNSRAADGGRSDLLRSVEFTKKWAAHPDNIVVVCWSLGALAAAALAIHGQKYLPVAHTVCLGGAFTFTDPIFGKQVSGDVGDGENRPPFTLLHGGRDDVVPLAASQIFASSLERAGWPVTLIELDTDHAGIAGAGYDAAADRYIAATDEESLAVTADVAVRVTAAIAGAPADD